MGEYTCDDCGESFDTPQGFGGHKASCGTDYDDSGEYICDNCGKEFTNPKSFAGHKSGCGELPWDDPELLERLYHDEGLSTFQIADRWENAEQTSVWYQLKKHDIETRSSPEGIRKRYASNITTSINGGRILFQFMEFKETRSILLSQLVMLLDHPPSEVFGRETHIHHQNEMPIDDRPVNLELMNGKEHSRMHGFENVKDIPRDGEGNFVKQ